MRMLSASPWPDEQALDVYALIESIADEDDAEAQGIMADFLDAFPEFIGLLWLGVQVDTAASGVAEDYMVKVRDWLTTRMLILFGPQGVWCPEDIADLDRVGIFA